ncbi:MAG: hypothetical protein R2762_29330 [Bryobacteraceae bacterium]
MLDRRDLLKLAPAILVPGREARASPGGYCEFRAKASVLVLSIPILHRDKVGAGFFRYEEQDAGGRKHLRLEFGAGSVPERAAGLNRMGLFEESIVERRGSLERAEYFGFMTSSPEENIEQAKSALASGAAPGVSAIRGRIENGRIVNRLARLTGLRHTGWTRWRDVTAEVRDRLEREGAGDVERDAAGEPVHTFLYAVRAAMHDDQMLVRSFVHNGEIYRLRTEPAADGAGITRITGKISKGGSRSETSFRLWCERSAPHAPVRFEFRPRSFLRLTFERVSS